MNLSLSLGKNPGNGNPSLHAHAAGKMGCSLVVSWRGVSGEGGREGGENDMKLHSASCLMMG